MSNVRVVSFDSLRGRLRDAIGEDSLLFERFDVALKNRDDQLVAVAMDSLKLYPEETRRKVEDVLLTWLFDDGDASGLDALPMAGSLPN